MSWEAGKFPGSGSGLIVLVVVSRAVYAFITASFTHSTPDLAASEISLSEA